MSLRLKPSLVVACAILTSTACSIGHLSAPTGPTPPGAPSGVTASAGDGHAVVTWTAPTANGGAPLTGYVLTPSGDGASLAPISIAGGATTQATVTGLTDGTAYTFVVAAVNAAGTGPASAPSAPVTPRASLQVPAAPTGVTASPGDAQASVSWTAPARNGGSAVTSYTVTSSPGALTATVSAPATSVVVNGLVNGTAYTFTVIATNSIGESLPSAPSAAVTPKSPGPTVPGAPTGVTAIAGNGQVTVSWTPPVSNGGSPVTGYSVSSSPGAYGLFVSAPSTTATLTGIANGISYRFTVYATNSVGNGPSSAASNAVTPVGPPGAPINVLAVAGNQQVTVYFNPPPSNGGSNITGYTATGSPGGLSQTVPDALAPFVFTGLTNGTTYQFTVTATNVAGTGPGAVTGTVTPATVPAPPTGVSAAPGNGQALVSWTAPADNGGRPIGAYTATATPDAGSVTVSSSYTSLLFPGLTNGTSYSFNVTASNGVGTSAPSQPSNAVTPTAPSLATSSVAANPPSIPADDRTTTALTVTVRDASGQPVAGQYVSLSPSGVLNTYNNNNGITDANGVFTMNLASGKAQTETITADINGVGTLTTSLTVTPSSCPGMPVYTASSLYSGSVGASAVVAADFNGDGKIDVAAADESSSNFGDVSVWLNQGNGTFVWGTRYEIGGIPGGASPISIVAGDFNRDGLQDLATANYNGSVYPLTVLLSAPDGGVAFNTTYDAGQRNPSDLATADFNGDGYLDIAVADFNSSGMDVFMGYADGGFAAPVHWAACAECAAIAVADFNHDGHPDVALASGPYVNTVYVLMGVGDGGFRPAATYAAGFTWNSKALAAGDFNEDGNPDLAVSTYDGGSVDILLGYGDGGFGPPTAYGTYNSRALGMAMGDFNGDGHLDLMVGGFTPGNAVSYVSYLKGNGDGTFTLSGSYPEPSGGQAWSVSGGDLNGDGFLDLLIAPSGSSATANASLLLYNGCQ